MEDHSRKEDITRAALAEFSQKSYDDASLNTILKNAGTSKGSFYYHFTDKKDLYLYLLRTSVEVKWEFIRKHTDLQDIRQDNIFQTFRTQARIGSKFGALHPDYHRLGRMFVKQRGTPVYDEAVKLLGGDSERILSEMIDKAISEKAFSELFPRDFLIKIFTHLFTHFEDIFEEENSSPTESTLEQLDLFVSFLQHGVERRSDHGQE